MKKIIIISLVAILTSGGVYSLLKEGDSNTKPAGSKSTSQDNQNLDRASDSAAIIFDGNTFSPETLNIRVGDTITVKNDSSRTIQFDSDPHPAHTDNTDLNIDIIRTGQSKSFIVTRTGTFGYHDHLNPSATGTIVSK